MNVYDKNNTVKDMYIYERKRRIYIMHTLLYTLLYTKFSQKAGAIHKIV